MRFAQAMAWADRLGEMMGADIPDSTRRLILRENMRRTLLPVFREKGITA